MADRTVTSSLHDRLNGAASVSSGAEDRLIPQNTNPSGMAQLKTIFPALVLIVPAITWNGTIAAKMHAHIRVSLRLISLNFGDPQYCSGT